MAALGFFTVGYARQGTAVLAGAGLRSAAVRAGCVLLARSTICRGTDSDRFCLELPAVFHRIGKGTFPIRLIGERLYRRNLNCNRIFVAFGTVIYQKLGM